MKQENIGEDWYTGDTYIYGIGRGYLLTTPLQVNAWTQVIANNRNTVFTLSSQKYEATSIDTKISLR